MKKKIVRKMKMNKRKIAKRYLELIYDYDANNSVFETYNEFKDKQGKKWEWLKDDINNLHQILEDTKFITYFVGIVNDCEEWDDICEEVEELENIYKQLEKQEELKKRLKIGTKVKFTDKYGIKHIGTIEEFETININDGYLELVHIRTYDDFIGRAILMSVGINQIKEIVGD
jgi:hypothetical protein